MSPFAGYENWQECMNDPKNAKYPEENRKKVCGSLKAKFESKDSLSPSELVKKIKDLQEKNNASLEMALELAFRGDFVENLFHGKKIGKMEFEP